jgi:hypothetical protein
MVEAVFALIGVVLGSISTIGYQALDARRARKDAAANAESTVATQVMDAFWARLDVAVRYGNLKAGERAAAFTAWGSARARLLESDIEDNGVVASWLDLVLTELDEIAVEEGLSWVDAMNRHGRVHQGLLGWRAQDEAIRRDVRHERRQLASKHWADDPVEDDEAAQQDN